MRRPNVQRSLSLRSGRVLAIGALALLLLFSRHALQSTSSVVFHDNGTLAVAAAGAHATDPDDGFEASADTDDGIGSAPALPGSAVPMVFIAATTMLGIVLVGLAVPVVLRRLVGALTRPLSPPPRALVR